VRLGVFFAENPQNQPGAKVLIKFLIGIAIVVNAALVISQMERSGVV